MAVESSTYVLDSLLEKLWLDEPWVPPRSWDSLPSRAGAPSQPPPRSSAPLYATSSVSEPSLVRLAMNALQGVESALISIEKLSALLCYSSADRSSHRIQSLWTRSSSTAVIGNLLSSIGQFGCIIFLLRRFVTYFTVPDIAGVRELVENSKNDSSDERKISKCNRTLINQAFAISVGKVIDGYMSALNTLSTSVSLRRFLKTQDGCLTSIGHSELTLLEVYLHTTGLRTQMQALGNICNVNHLTVDFPKTSLEDLMSKSDSEFSAFPRSGALLSFLYAQLKVADPGHCALLKFLFLQSYEPYCDFIRSWLYDGSISDPYSEFVVECISDLSLHASGDPASAMASALPLPTIRVREGVDVPCFLEDSLVPLCRTGQQLQVVMKLLEVSNNVGACVAHEKILPSLVDLSSEYPWFAFPLAFDKETIEEMVVVRANYYQHRVEKIESILTKFDFTFREAATEGASFRLLNNPTKNLNHQASSVAGESSFAALTDSINQNMPDAIVDFEGLSIIHDHSSAEDHLESSECSSESTEEENEADNLLSTSHTPEPSYLSALDVSLSSSTDNTMQILYQCEICSEEDFSCKYKYAALPSHKETYCSSCEQKLSQTLETQLSSSRERDLSLFDDYVTSRGEDTWLRSPDFGLKLSIKSYGLPNTDLDLSDDVSDSNKDVHTLITNESLKAFNLQFSKLKYDSTYFSTNPMLKRGSFFNPRTMGRESNHVNHINSCFEFTVVKDPLNTYAVKLAGIHVPNFGTELSVKTETHAAAAVDNKNHLNIEEYQKLITGNKPKSCNVSSPQPKDKNEERILPQNISGGCTWQSLLGKSGFTANRSVSDHRMKLMTGVDMPLDFVIKKCVLDEILLHYKYLSKLTIKLLIEGFKLQEHLQSLRCYHFMELADWADLFIMSLWQHKWHGNEVDKRITEIQGILELAVRRSSCERDPNKDRLYVYLKEDSVRNLPASAIGIHSFDYLGLGYRIDWPVSIILTPAALKIYSDIFNFLIQVKLAVFSLSDVWSSLKGYRLEQHKGEVFQISILIETRHKLNHFVSMLQQYVESQLSQVSWYRFLQSLKHEVKDMLDLESVHMAYVTESLHICFLSTETQSIAGIIQNILQCAMDFRSFVTGTILGAGSVDEKLTHKFSQVDMSQVHIMRRAFDTNLKELYLIYLKSPKHGELGLSRFWDYLNYNDYYAGLMTKQMGHRIFYS